MDEPQRRPRLDYFPYIERVNDLLKDLEMIRFLEGDQRQTTQGLEYVDKAENALAKAIENLQKAQQYTPSRHSGTFTPDSPFKRFEYKDKHPSKRKTCVCTR